MGDQAIERSEEGAARLLLSLTRSLAESSTRDEIAHELTQAIPRLLGVERSAVLLWDEATRTLSFRAISGMDPATESFLLQTVFTPEEDPELEYIMAHRECRHHRAESADPRMRETMTKTGADEIFLAPIVIRAEFLGALSATRVVGSPPLREDDRTLCERMSAVADLAALAMDNARLHELERETLARLREASDFRSEFLGVVSHELRTPLAAIMGMSRTLAARGEQLDEVVRKDFVNAIVERGEQLERLVEDLLQSSRELDLRPEPIDLVLLCNGAIDTVRQLSTKTIVELKAPERLPAVADGGRLRQVLDNLLTNAIKYAPDSPIEIAAGRNGDSLWLTVSDHGPGMETAQVEKAFDAFYQAPGHGDAKGGVGLGLYISKRIVEAHEGTIKLETEPGQGTKVIITLPATGPI